MIDTNVLICGSGPVGLTLATQLQRQGLSCRLIDRLETPSPYSKALVVWARSLELLSLSMNIEPFMQNGLPVKTAEFHSGDKRIGTIPFSGANCRFGAGVMIPQNKTEAILTAQLRSVGVEVERNTELVSFEDRGDHVISELRGPNGNIETVHSHFLVGCDGAHSAVRHGLGLEFHGEQDSHRWLLADTLITGTLPDAEILLCWHPQGVLIFFRIDQDRWRIIGEKPLLDTNSPKIDPTLEDIQTLVDERSSFPVKLHDPVWLSEFRINERKVDSYRVGRVMLAGDSAHIHSPAGGQGMNTGMQDACNLAWKLGMVQRGLAGENLLDSYSVERSEIGEQVLKAATRVTNVATLKNPILQTARNTLAHFAMNFHWVHEQARDQLSELAIHYANSPIAGIDQRHVVSGPHIGDRVPDVCLHTKHSDSTKNLYELLGCGMNLVIVNSDFQNDAEAVSSERLLENSAPQWKSDSTIIEISLLSDDTARTPTGLGITFAEAKKLGLADGGFLLVRPDGYLAAAGNLASAEPVLQWFDSVGVKTMQVA